jgi:large subunit ribosomal protein L15
MQMHEVQHSSRPKKTRVGRGGIRGKTSGRGHKGQKARAGGSPRPEIRDMIKKIPKQRGHGKNRAKTVNSGRTEAQVVNLHDLVNLTGDVVSPSTLSEQGLVSKNGGKQPLVKILGNGEIDRAVTVTDCHVSKSAAEKIAKAGGKVTS